MTFCNRLTANTLRPVPLNVAFRLAVCRLSRRNGRQNAAQETAFGNALAFRPLRRRLHGAWRAGMPRFHVF